MTTEKAAALDVERLRRAIDAAWPVLHSAIGRGDIRHAEALAAEYARLAASTESRDHR